MAEERKARFQSFRGELAAVLVVAIATAASWFVFGRSQLPDVVMIYLLGIVLVAMRFGQRASLVATVLSVLLVDFLFVPPYLSLTVAELKHVVTFAVMFVVAVVISRLTQRIREQAEEASARERHTARLYALSRELASSQDIEHLASVATRHLHDAFEASIAVMIPDAEGRLGRVSVRDDAFVPAKKDLEVATSSFAKAKSERVEDGTSFVPLPGTTAPVGVIGIRRNHDIEHAQRPLFDAFVAQIASAIERAQLAEKAQRSQLEMETERMRSSLLSAVSHDLRTPLGVITGSASTLLDTDAKLSESARRDLLETIHEEAQRLHRLVRNLLDMTRLQSGALTFDKELHPIDELVGVALARLEDRLAKRKVEVELRADLPPVLVDAVLVEQVLINLLENALKYTPEGTAIDIAARVEGPNVVVRVRDRGPGVPVDEREKIFEKFHRGGKEGASGAGLGLAICRGVVEAHGGRIWVDEPEGGGAVFSFTLPAGRLSTPPESDA